MRVLALDGFGNVVCQNRSSVGAIIMAKARWAMPPMRRDWWGEAEQGPKCRDWWEGAGLGPKYKATGEIGTDLYGVCDFFESS